MCVHGVGVGVRDGEAFEEMSSASKEERYSNKHT